MGVRPPAILYLNTDPGARIPQMTLAGMRRYAFARGWTAEAFSSEESRQEAIPALMETSAPVVGCVYECSDDNLPASPKVFGCVPIVYLHALPSVGGGRILRIQTDNEAVAVAAFRELSANRPATFAVVGVPETFAWSAARAGAFAALAAKSGASCSVFQRRDEKAEARAKRLVAFMETLPKRTAIFAVNDLVATEVIAAARSAHRAIPRELTLLGVDNLPSLCEASHPTISSIQIDFERAGYVAASMLAATMKSRAAHGMKGLASLEMKGAARAANDGIPSFGGEAATLHCAEGATSLPAERAPSLERAHDGGAVIGPLLVVRRESTSGWGRREAFVLQAVERIRREACDGLTAHDVIAAAPVSRSLFILRFREAVGHSVQDEIEHVRMERVFTLLRDTKTPISAIAALCGWRSDIALRWLFRRRTGMSMRQWRRENA